MKENLNSDVIDMEENIKIYSRTRKSTGEILQVLNFPGYETDSLNLYLGRLGDYATFIETTSAYENLKTIGFEIIKSDSLKKNIMQIYGKQYQLIYNQETVHANYVNLHLNSVIFDNLIMGVNQMSSPIDISELKQNRRFNETLKFNYGHLDLLTTRYSEIKLDVEALVEQIDAVLKQRK